MPRITNKPFAEVQRLMLPSGQPLSRSAFAGAMDRHERGAARTTLLWDYYRNRMDPGAGRGRALTLAQERGLPARVTGTWDRRTPAARFVGDDRAWQRKEVVIENDIAWRIQTMVDFMFGRPITIASTAADPAQRRTIERVLEAVWESSGGIALLQDLGLMGHVYGHVDLLVRANQSRAAQAAGDSASAEGDTAAGATPREPLGGVGGGESGGEGGASIAERAISAVRIELIEPPRGVALPSETDYREIDAYFIRTRRESREESASRPGAALAGTLVRWWKGDLGGPPLRGGCGSILTTTEVFAGSTRQLFETDADGHTRLIDEGPALVEERPGDRPPIVHIQNISQPFEYSGLGEVEPLIPLQDELNTRLSDRAARVTMQSFKKHL